MSHWSDVRFSVNQRPLASGEIEQARAMVQEQLRSNSRKKSRLHQTFLLQSVIVIAVIAVLGQVSPALFNWKWDAFVRLVALCAATTFFVQKVFISYHHGKSIATDESHLLRLQSQLKEIDLQEHLQFARDHVFSFEVLQYMNAVNEQGRCLLVGELQALQDASLDDPKEAGVDMGARRRYV